MIARRTSTLDENSILFFRRHRVAAGTSGPAGYRSGWDEKNKVAVAKLAPKVSGVPTSEYPSILLNQGNSGTDAEFVELHVYGPITHKAIEKIIGPAPIDPDDRVIFRRLQNILKPLNIPFEEK